MNNIFFLPFDILQYKFLSYREVLHVLSESSELSQLSELIELRLVSRSSETSQSSISFHPAFPDALLML